MSARWVLRLASPRGRAARRGLGLACLVTGAGLVLATALAATGAVPLWRPAVPPPLALEESTALPAVAPPPRVLAARPEAVPLPLRDAWPPAEPTAAAAEATPLPSPTPLPVSAAAPPAPTLPAPPTPVPTAPRAPVGRVPTLPPTPTLAPTPTPVPPLPSPGLPVRLVIPSIGVDTPVVQLDVRFAEDGTPYWDTVPFVAGHYTLTGLVGAPANVVFSGHVVTRDMGNVFRDLYRLRPGEPVVVYTAEGEFTYRVVAVRLVKPWEIDVLAPSPEPRITLITCAGEYDFRTRAFTDRLVVVGTLVTPERAAPGGVRGLA
jgi:LPXTG-site transpeptidase (sortase) family protein